jgi:hypothetical protein
MATVRMQVPRATQLSLQPLLQEHGHSVQPIDQLTRPGAFDAAVLQLKSGAPLPSPTELQPIAAKLLLVLEQPDEKQLRALESYPDLGGLYAPQGASTIGEVYQAVLRFLDPPPPDDASSPSSEGSAHQRYLQPDAVVHHQRLTNSLDRGRTIDAIDGFLSGLKIERRLTNQLITIADELITNAFYDAPIDPSGRRQNALLSRIDPVECPSDRPIDVTYGYDGRRSVVAVKDRYGTLTMRALLHHLARPLARADAGGTKQGLGLATALRAASQLAFYLAPQRWTECIGIIENADNYREFLSQGKSVYAVHLA